MLNLHQVTTRRNPFYPPLHPELFEELLVFLKARFLVTTFREAPTARGERPVAILSFDDGYHDFVDVVAPLLAKHGLRANQNVIASCVRTGVPPWPVKLCDLLDGSPPSLIRELPVPSGVPRSAATEDEKMRYGVALTNRLKAMPRHERDPVRLEIERALDRADVRLTRMMDLRDVREMAEARHEIGCHSYDHESMGTEDMSYFEADLAACERSFATDLALPLDIYSFPNGSYREEHLSRLRSHPTIRHVLLVGEAFARPGGPVYPRFTISAEGRAELRLQALGYRARPLL